MYGTGLGGFSRGLGFPLSFTLSADELFDGDGRLLALP